MENELVVVLDVKGLQCPMPLLKTKKALKDIPPGGLLRVYATDPGSVKDFQVFSLHSRHTLLESTERDGVFSYLLQKNAV
ncbi:MAG: sulfurtransferase TusA family protein [Gammaproteobacteria bacterium]|nr:sulfurtransferase TusA family protein [Gammaproteobacteria bacterium]MXW06641.1 sulfurtransferase TusA family protein [Gammaproteobacteria bacterium]MYC25181.1 sulfurtransferase TusA family protein [Gammaproteobacteria bacterium]